MPKRFRIPPPPPLGLDAGDGAGILTENPARLGTVLWDLARDALEWTHATPAEALQLCAPEVASKRMAAIACTGIDSVLAGQLESISRVVSEPWAVNRPGLSLACTQVAAWAEDEGAVSTAAAFAHIAAAVCSGNAAAAYRAGRLARRRAEYARAEMWLTRAILLGRQVEDWDSYGRAFSGLGNVYVQRGNYPKARKYHTRCLRVARRHGLRPLEGDALHDLCVIAGEVGHLDEMAAYARAAREVLKFQHPQLAILASDVADAWLAQGLFIPALQVFDVTRPYWRAADVVLGVANICRAAAGAGERERFEQAWAEAWSLIKSSTTRENTAQALLDLARGAASLKEWDRAEAAAQRSLVTAAERQENRVRFTAEAVLESVVRTRAITPEVIHSADAEPYRDANALAAEFVESLAVCAAA